MTRNLKRRGAIRALVLVAVLAAIMAVSAGSAAANQQASAWGPAPFGQTLTLTNTVGEPSDGTGPQPALGIALIGLGTGVLLVGLATTARRPRRVAGRWGSTAHSRAGA